jgi:hypothetical protein
MPEQTITVTPGEPTILRIVVEGASDSEMPSSRKTRKNRKNEGVTRKNRKQSGGKGPNGYMKFAKEYRPKVLEESPELKSDVVAVARKIGKAWRELSEEERKKY